MNLGLDPASQLVRSAVSFAQLHEIHESAVLPPRAATFLAIAGLHAVFGYLFITGLAHTLVTFIPPIIEVVPVPEERPDDPAKAVPEPDYPETIVDVPKPVIDDVIVPDEPITAPVAALMPDTPPVREPPITVVPPDPIIVTGSHRLPNTADYYPPAKIRDGTEGAADVRVCVDVNGRRQGEPTVLRSSGSADLDRAAAKVARDGRYGRSTQGGRPVPNCHSFRIVFELND